VDFRQPTVFARGSEFEGFQGFQEFQPGAQSDRATTVNFFSTSLVPRYWCQPGGAPAPGRPPRPGSARHDPDHLKTPTWAPPASVELRVSSQYTDGGARFQTRTHTEFRVLKVCAGSISAWLARVC
jgi:hypothetical protein